MIIKTTSGICYHFVDVTKVQCSKFEHKIISDKWRCLSVYFDCAGCPRVAGQFDIRFKTKAGLLSFFKKQGIKEIIE